MDVVDKNPAELNSFLINTLIRANTVDLTKKRKLQDEQLGFPLLKHKCLDRSSTFECGTLSFTDDPRTDKAFHTCKSKGKTEKVLSNGRSSGSELVKDRNSLSEDSYSVISAYAEAKVEPECTKSYTYDHPSTSSGSCSSDSVSPMLYSSDSSDEKVISTSAGKGTFMNNRTVPPNLEGGMQVESEYQNHEEQTYADHIFSDYKNKGFELDEDPEDMVLYSNGATSNMYVLSSGRWNVNQGAEARGGSQKLTIDQEFEQYFSTLML